MAFTISTPRLGHQMAAAAGQDAANRQMSEAGRKRWNRADWNLAAETMQTFYAAFNILNAEQWMPAGYAWRRVKGEWRPIPIAEQRAA